MANELVQVCFHGDTLEAVEQDGQVWVSVRRVCESLGLAPNGQIEKLKEKEWAVDKFILSTASDGKRYETYCIHLDSLPMWLATIDVGRVAEHVRPKLILYQKEAARVLADHFLPHRARPGTGDPLLDQLKAMVTLRESQVRQQQALAVIDARVGAIEADRDQARRQLLVAERSELPAPDKTTRAKLNELVRIYQRSTGTPFPDIWARLYREAYYRLHINAGARSKNSKKTQLDVIEEAGLLPDLYAIASEVLTF